MTNIGGYRYRPSARILVINSSLSVLLFRFIYNDGPLKGRDYWAAPGGKLEVGESYEEAAIRELREETGINVFSVGLPVAYKKFIWEMPDGEVVICLENFFIVHVDSDVVSKNGWTKNEKNFIFEYKWWSEVDLKNSTAEIWCTSSDLI